MDFWYLLRESYECSPVSPPRRPNLASRASGLKPYLSSVPRTESHEARPCPGGSGAVSSPLRRREREISDSSVDAFFDAFSPSPRASSSSIAPPREGTGIPSRRASSRRRAPPVVGADLRAALVASCLRGALPPVDFLAVCFVRAIAVDRSAFESVDAVAARGLDTDRLGELQDSATRAVATDGARALEGETAP